MGIKKILWLEDQYEDFTTYRSPLFRNGFIVEAAQSVSELERKIRKDDYIAVIFDLKVLPGDDEKWLKLDVQKRTQMPYFDSYLGLELLRAIFNPVESEITLVPPIKVDPEKVIVFSVVNDEKVLKELISFRIPERQIVYKSESTIRTLPALLEEMQNEE